HRRHAGSQRAPPAPRAARRNLVPIRNPPVNSKLTPLKPDRRLEDERTALSKIAITNSFLDDLFYMQGKFPALATENDYYMALAYAVRDRMLQRWISTAVEYTKSGSRTVVYLSAEFLTGPHLGNNLLNLNIIELVRECLG